MPHLPLSSNVGGIRYDREKPIFLFQDSLQHECIPWFDAVWRGEWCEAKEFLTLHPSAITATDSEGRTALHLATKKGREQIVEELVQLMTEEQLETKNDNGETALTIAAAENIKIVRCLVARNKKLLGIAPDSSQMTPILIAAENHQWDIVRYLYSFTPLEDLKPDKGPCGSELVSYCLQAKQFDIAWDLLRWCPRLFCTQGLTTYPMYEYALLPFAFSRICKNLSFHLFKLSILFIYGLIKNVVVRINNICEQKLHHVRSRKILDLACDSIKDLNNKEMMAYRGLRDTVFLAVQNGIVELVMTLCKAKPELLDMKGKDGKSIFHHAVECRQENVYSLIYGTSKRNYLATLKDNSRNSMLHYAGMLSPLEKLDGIAGAALQMQRERQWYKEVESIVVTAPGASPFKEDCLTAARVFTLNHKELHEKGQKWMKDTASSYIIVNALIITIMFAAAFTVPGGNNQETGFPVFLNEKLFMVFIVSDAISLFSSVTSALMFLCILTSRYAEDDFLKSLPTKMIFGLSTLFISVATMMVAFSSAIFLMLRDKSWIITPITFLAGIPVILFVSMQFPHLVEISMSTYGRGIFNRKSQALDINS
ncbi:unnamed protein product [Malus baccata var. baccata]